MTQIKITEPGVYVRDADGKFDTRVPVGTVLDVKLEGGNLPANLIGKAIIISAEPEPEPKADKPAEKPAAK